LTWGRALQHQVAFVPGHPFYIGREDGNTLRLNNTNTGAETIEQGIARLGRLMAEI
jgi:2-aminoadipate transaminase